MKTRVSFFLFCLQMIAISGFAVDNRIDGNRNVTTREFKISDYDEISFVGSADFEYEQSDKAPFLSITIDENLFEYLDVKVEGRTLKVAPKMIRDGHRSSSYNIQPTTYKIKSSSKKLAELNLVGSGNFTLNKSTQIDKLEINKAGSGSVLLNGKMTGRKLECSMAGSGSIIAQNLDIESLECSVAGSGKIQLKGKADRADFSVAGSGQLDAYKCVVRKADCSTAGSGEIHTYVEEYLEANVAGSGEIYYKGNPEISKSVRGSGSIKKVN